MAVEKGVERGTMKGERKAWTVPHRFWGEVSQAPHRLLLLDYDGTLAPFQVDRMSARPVPGIAARLAEIARGRRTTVALVSGRPVREVEALLPLEGVIYVGEHGWEVRLPGRKVTAHRLPPGVEVALEEAAALSRAGPWGGQVEIKRTAIVLHTRGLPAQRASDLVSQAAVAFEAVGRPAGLTLTRINGGIELRASDLDKGSAVLGILDLLPAETCPVYLGDDVTDEDAFRALRGRGFGLRVGGATAASGEAGWLEDPEAVSAFLREWLRRIEAPPGMRGGWA